MTLTQLEYIVSLDKHRNFAQAAKHSFVTQPTLSAQVQKLEDFLQVKIFDRTKQPVVPTEIGKSIIVQAKVIIRESKRLEEIISNEKGIVKGEFHLGIIPTVSVTLVPLFLQAFLEKFPEVKLVVSEVQTEDLIKKILAEEIDGGIAATPLDNPGLTEKPLYYEPFQLYLHKGHSLEEKTEIQGLELTKQNVLLMAEGHCYKNQVEEICRLRSTFDQSDRVNFQSSNFSTLISLVDRNAGITLLPQLVIDDLPNASKKMIRPFKGKTPTREISLIYRRGVVKEAILNGLIEVIRSCVPSDIQTNDKRGSKVLSPL